MGSNRIGGDMPKMKYALEKGGPKRLEISYKGNWKDFTVLLDGNIIGTITDIVQLKAGKEFTLDDGSSLKVQYKFPVIRLFRNGQPLPFNDPAQILKFAYGFTFMVATVNLMSGLTGMLLGRPIVEKLPQAGLESFVLGVVFLVLGFFIMRKSKIALAIAVTIYVLSSISVFIFYDISRTAMIVGILFRVVILLVMIQGFAAISALKQIQSNNSIS